MLVDKKYVLKNREFVIRSIIDGSIFIYPTDTVYGLGCSALKEERCKKINEIKKRDKPLSIIAPSKRWIRNNTYMSEEDIAKLPGSITILTECKENIVASTVNNGSNIIGVRMIDHWFQSLVTSANIPFVTTSANITGKETVENVRKMSEDLIEEVDLVIDDGDLKAEPSKVYDSINKKYLR